MAGIESDRVSFSGHAHGLSGRLHRPLAGPRATALFAHCFTCSKDLKAAITIADALAAQGIAVLRFDFTGLGESGGTFSDTTFSSDVEDLVAAADYLRREFLPPQILVGHSLGGAAVLAAAERIPEARAVATVGAPADPAHVSHLFAEAEEDIKTAGAATVKIAGRSFTIKQSFLEDLARQSLADRVGKLRKALLVLHAPRDEVVDIDNAAQIFEAALHPKSFVSLDDANHLLTRDADAEYAAHVIAAWSARYLDPDSAVASASTAEESVRVRTGAGSFATEIVAAGHPLRADEPASVGGGNTGPTPYGLLLAALGSCTSMTLQMYAARKGWGLKVVDVRLAHSKIHARDCEECESEQGKVDIIDREIRLEGDLDDEQRQGLLRIADRCPVHRTLEGEIQVRSRLAGGD